jgi:hypothetical protein
MEEVCRQDRHRTLLKGKTSNTRRAEDRLKNNESNRMDVGHLGDKQEEEKKEEVEHDVV